MANLQGDSSNAGVAGVVGTNSASGVGVWGDSAAGRGVVGVSRTGAGVWGHTITGRGVVGAIDEEGAGVWGETQKGRGVVGITHKEGDGVWGDSPSGRGVVGISKTGAGVWGQTATGRAVVGAIDEDGVGVWGETQKGRGVVGISHQDVGVYGKGAQLAGLFEGKVSVTDDLLVQGVSLQAMVQTIQLLQQQIKDLQKQSGQTPTPPPSSQPQISVSSQSGTFAVSGSGFLATTNVTIRVVDDAFNTLTFRQSTDSTGQLSATLPISCVSGLSLHFSATDSRPNPSDLTGVLWSNTITTTCP